MAWGRGVLAEGRDVLARGRDDLSGVREDFVRESDFLQGDITYCVVSSLNFVQNGYELRGVSILIDICKNRYFW